MEMMLQSPTYDASYHSTLSVYAKIFRLTGMQMASEGRLVQLCHAAHQNPEQFSLLGNQTNQC